MKFETINGVLCRMVEPEPIFGSTKAPFVIMGKNTKHPTIITQDMDVLLRIFLVAYSDEFEIIGYPVVDGSAEWALYQMMHGKWVHNPELEKHKTETTDTRCLHAYAISGDNVIVKNIVTGETSVLGTARPDNVIVYFETTGWQLYEPQPEPKPAYAVGDFVKYDIDTYLRVIEPSGKEKTLCKTLSGVIVYPYTSCLTKASPSEVIVKIGCLKGTIERHDGNPQYWFKLRSSEYHYALISIEMLDTPTRELVESLLKEKK